jgi:hypothetical protein
VDVPGFRPIADEFAGGRACTIEARPKSAGNRLGGETAASRMAIR